MPTSYPVKLDVHLRSVWHDTPPEINIGINNHVKKITLSTDQTFCYDFIAVDDAVLTIELLNKTNSDTVLDKGLDKAVIIESISFFDITDPRFVWAGIYQPQYPEPWATEQQNQGITLAKQITGQTHLSWNGKWSLNFSVPIFTWIHQVQNLGWIYN